MFRRRHQLPPDWELLRGRGGGRGQSLFWGSGQGTGEGRLNNLIIPHPQSVSQIHDEPIMTNRYLNKTHCSFPGTAPPTTPTARCHSSNTWDSLLLLLLLSLQPAVRIANQLEDWILSEFHFCWKVCGSLYLNNMFLHLAKTINYVLSHSYRRSQSQLLGISQIFSLYNTFIVVVVSMKQ